MTIPSVLADPLAIESIQTETVPLPEFEPIDLRWRAECMRGYLPLDSLIEVDQVLMLVGEPGYDFIVVQRLARSRFAQAMGDPAALIIEVCDTAGSMSPLVWRLRRAHDRLPHAELGATLFDGGMDPDNLFTVTEAFTLFRDWLGSGSVSGVSLDPVDY